MKLQNPATSLSTRNDSQVAFGAANFTKIKNVGASKEFIENLCNKCPKLDEFTHKHNVSLNVEEDFFTDSSHKRIMPSLEHLSITLKVKDAPKNLREKFTNLFRPKTKKINYSTTLYYDDEEGTLSRNNMENSILEILNADDLEKRLKKSTKRYFIF